MTIEELAGNISTTLTQIETFLGGEEEEPLDEKIRWILQEFLAEGYMPKSKKSGLPAGMHWQNLTPEDRESQAGEYTPKGKGSSLEREIEQARKALHDAAREEIRNEIKPAVKDGLQDIKHEYGKATAQIKETGNAEGVSLAKAFQFYLAALLANKTGALNAITAERNNTLGAITAERNNALAAIHRARPATSGADDPKITRPGGLQITQG